MLLGGLTGVEELLHETQGGAWGLGKQQGLGPRGPRIFKGSLGLEPGTFFLGKG